MITIRTKHKFDNITAVEIRRENWHGLALTGVHVIEVFPDKPKVSGPDGLVPPCTRTGYDVFGSFHATLYRSADGEHAVILLTPIGDNPAWGKPA